MMEVFWSWSLGSGGGGLVGTFGVRSAFKELAFFVEIFIKIEFGVEVLLCHVYLLIYYTISGSKSTL